MELRQLTFQHRFLIPPNVTAALWAVTRALKSEQLSMVKLVIAMVAMVAVEILKGTRPESLRSFPLLSPQLLIRLTLQQVLQR